MPEQGMNPPLELYPGSFIYVVPDALDAAACDAIVSRFESSPEHQYPGRIGQAGELHDEVKRSTDLRLSGRREWQDLDAKLLFELFKQQDLKSIQLKI